MEKHALAAIAAAAISLSLTAFAQGPRRDGLWEVKTEMQMEGMPMNMPPTTTQQCITPAAADDPGKATPPGRGGRGGGEHHSQRRA
jgi:hypothetical protein